MKVDWDESQLSLGVTLRCRGVSVTDGQTDRRTFAIVESLSRLKNIFKSCNKISLLESTSIIITWGFKVTYRIAVPTVFESKPYFVTRDVVYVSSNFLVLSQCLERRRDSVLRVVTESSQILRTFEIGSYFTNLGLVHDGSNGRRLLVKMFNLRFEQVLMFDIDDMCDRTKPDLQMKFHHLRSLKVKNLAYDYFRHYFQEGGRDSGYVITKTYVSSYKVIEIENKKHLSIKSLDFLSS